MPTASPELFTLLYTSALSPSALVADVAKIAKVSRRRNQHDGITGLLVFDGENFAQLVEGPRQALDSLRERLAVDRRHGSMEILVFEPGNGGRQFPGWDLGFHFCHDGPATLSGLSRLRGPAALACFNTVRAQVDRLAEQALPTPLA